MFKKLVNETLKTIGILSYKCIFRLRQNKIIKYMIVLLISIYFRYF